MGSGSGGGAGGGFWEGLGVIALAIAGVFLGASILEKLTRSTSPCPVCGKPVSEGTSPCPNCKTVLRWERQVQQS